MLHHGLVARCARLRARAREHDHAPAPLRRDEAIALEFGDRLVDGVRVDAEVLGDRPHARVKIASCVAPAPDRGTEAVRDLAEDRDRGIRIDEERERHGVLVQ